MPIQLSCHEQAHWTCARHQYLGVSGHQICSGELRRQLAALGTEAGGRGRGAGRGSALKGTKVAPKYRNPKNRAETWAGRGPMPRWMAAAVKEGKAREDFPIDKSATAAKAKKGPAKKGRPRKKK